MRYYTLKHFVLIELKGHSSGSHYFRRSKRRWPHLHQSGKYRKSVGASVVEVTGSSRAREKTTQEEIIARDTIDADYNNLATSLKNKIHFCKFEIN